jgi:hypothetical protein
MPSTSIRVFCRFRPLNGREKEIGGDVSGFLRLTDDEIGLDGMDKKVTFDRAFGPDTDQQTMVSACAARRAPARRASAALPASAPPLAALQTAPTHGACIQPHPAHQRS